MIDTNRNTVTALPGVTCSGGFLSNAQGPAGIAKNSNCYAETVTLLLSFEAHAGFRRKHKAGERPKAWSQTQQKG